MRAYLALLLLPALAGPVLAQDHPLPDIPPGDTRGDDAPGRLSAHDVAGKRLLDANGVELGHISGVDRNGDAIIRGPGGHRKTVPLSRLSKGTGPNTIIESADSGAQRLNRMEAAPPPPPPNTP